MFQQETNTASANHLSCEFIFGLIILIANDSDVFTDHLNRVTHTSSAFKTGISSQTNRIRVVVGVGMGGWVDEEGGGGGGGYLSSCSSWIM